MYLVVSHKAKQCYSRITEVPVTGTYTQVTRDLLTTHHNMIICIWSINDICFFLLLLRHLSFVQCFGYLNCKIVMYRIQNSIIVWQHVYYMQLYILLSNQHSGQFMIAACAPKNHENDLLFKFCLDMSYLNQFKCVLCMLFSHSNSMH